MHAFKSLHIIADNSLKNNFQVSGVDPGKIKGGGLVERSKALYEGGRAPPPASPEAKFFAFYNLLTLLPSNCHINK